MSRSITAKVKLGHKGTGDPVSLQFSPDYEGGRNAEWASATPYLDLRMNVKPDVAEHFEEGAAYTLTFTKSEDEADGDHEAPAPETGTITESGTDK